jgi:hypothetical protein
MAQQNKSTLQSSINTLLADNTSGDISAADVRNNLIDITDSLVFNNGDQVITGSLEAASFTGSLDGTATTASYVDAANVDGTVANATTASLSLETMGAGDPLNTSGGEIQVRGGYGIGSPDGKNTYSSAFTFNQTNSGLNIGDPITTFGYGNYYLAVGQNAVAGPGNYTVTFGSGSSAIGEGSFAQGLNTIASGSFQFAQGKYNTQGDNTSLMIIGNGTADNTRSDAFKVKMSGSIVLPTTQSAAPSWTGTDGEMVFATVTGDHFFYVWMAGAWRSGSLE